MTTLGEMGKRGKQVDGPRREHHSCKPGGECSVQQVMDSNPHMSKLYTLRSGVMKFRDYVCACGSKGPDGYRREGRDPNITYVCLGCTTVFHNPIPYSKASKKILALMQKVEALEAAVQSSNFRSESDITLTG